MEKPQNGVKEGGPGQGNPGRGDAALGLIGIAAAEALADYEEKKRKLAEEIRQSFQDGHKQTIALDKESSNLFRSRAKESEQKRIDVRSFNRVLSVDKERMIADVEGMTSYEELVKETLKYDCLPTVVPELKSITIGGALSGCGIESSSFRYGLVHETIEEMELLLGSGRVVVCTPENEYKDLFFAFPNSYGTLGYALRVKVRLIPVKKYVKLSHYYFSDPLSYFEELNRLCNENRESGPISYIDGVIFNEKKMAIITGQFVDEACLLSDYHYMHIYYRSICEKPIDYLTTLDYIWRWDTDWFWCSKAFFMQNWLFRFLFGKFLLKSTAYTKMMRMIDRNNALKSLVGYFRGKRESIIQDVLIPVKEAPRFLKFFQQEIGIAPIWICPTHPLKRVSYDLYPFDLCPLDPDTLYIDFGFWDSKKTDREEGYYNKMIERKVRELKGFKSLYSSSFYTEEEFWQLYDHSRYLQLKEKYDPQAHFKDLYQKCVSK